MPKNRRAGLFGGLVAASLLVLVGCGGGGGSAGGSGGEAAGSVNNASPAPTGAVATKMQPQLNGWAFPNFPSATFPDINFDTADLVSMFGAGGDVCVDGVAEPCTLTAEAAAWARMVNQARATGHCEGLVALASARFNKAELPETVKLPSQEDEVRALMRAFATQFVPEVQAAIEKWTKASLAEKVDELKRSFTSDKLEYTLGVYVEGGGHAILPYAVEYPTPDIARIMVYDSNWPGRNRYVDVDLTNDKWTFSFAGDDPTADPNAWTGGAADMDLTPFEARQGSCPFCGDGTTLQSTTLLVRTENLDWSVETGSGEVSPTSAASGDGASARPVKGGVSILRVAAPAGGRSSYDYVISIPNDLLDGGNSGATTTVNGSQAATKRAKLNFGGASSVFAVMKSGVAQFTTPGGNNSTPVEIGTTSIKSNDPNVDLTLAAGNLVANASGSSVELGSTGGTLEVAVTTATGEVIQQQVTPEAPAVQVKADESGAVTVLQASATGEVKKTEVAADGTKTETVVDSSALNLNKVEVELPPALASKAIEALPKLEERSLSNPNYKADEAYVPPTTLPAPKENAAAPTTTVAARGETPSTVQTRNAALPTTTAPRSVTAAGATPTTIAAVVKPTVTNFRVAAKTFGDDAFTLDPPDSNSPGGFRYSSSRPEVATVGLTTGRVTIVGAGTTTITATQAAARGFEAATITATLSIAKAKPTIAETKDIVKTFSDDPFSVKDPVSTSSGAFTYSSNNEDVLKQSKTTGRWVIGGAGRATITVSQAATDDFLAASDTFVVTVRKGTPDVKAPADVAKSFLDADFDLPKPTSDSKGAFTYSSSDANIVGVTGTKASIKSAGTVTITASQAATDDWLAASTTFKIVVSSKAPTLTEFADVTKTFGDDSFTLAAPKSNSTGGFTFKSSDEKVVTIGESTGKVTLVAPGTATITATQAASGGFSSASVSAKITVSKADPVVSDLLVADKEFGDADFTLKATAKGSGKFTYSTDKPDIFNVDAETGVVKIVGVGTAILSAKLSSTTTYEAGSVSASVTVKKGTPTLAWSLDPKTFGDPAFDLAPPTSRSAGKFSYSVSSADATIATVTESGRVTIVKAGTVTITAKQTATTNWNEASTTATLTIDKAAPTITNFVIPAKSYGAANFTLVSPTSNSPTPFEFGVVAGTSSEPNVATVSASGTVVVGSAGTVTVRAKQEASENFTAGSVTAVFTVGKVAQLLAAQPGFGVVPTNIAVNSPEVMSVVGDSGLVGVLSYSVVNTGSAQCVLTKNEITNAWSISASQAGTCVIRGTKGGDRNFLPASTPDTTVTVSAATFTAPTNLQATVNGSQVTLSWNPGTRVNATPFMWDITWFDMDTGQATGGWGIWNYGNNRTSVIILDAGTSGYGLTRFSVRAGSAACVGEGPGTCTYGPRAERDVEVLAPGTYKVNEGGSISVSAPTGQVVTKVDFASYGTPTVSNGSFVRGSCHASSSQQKVEEALLGKTSGTIAASNGVFGDPCGGTYKRLYLSVTFGADAFPVQVGGTGSDRGSALLPLSDGSMIVIGTHTGPTAFGTSVLDGRVDPASPSSFLPQTYLARLSPTGFWTWAQNFSHGSANLAWYPSDSSGGEVGSLVADVFPDDSIVIAGRFGGSLTLGSTVLSTSCTTGELFVAKMSATRTWLWAVQSGGCAYNTVPLGVAAAANGSVYVSARFQYSPVTLGSTTLSPSTSRGFVAQITSSGSWGWVAGTVADCEELRLEVGATGDVFAYGTCGLFNTNIWNDYQYREGQSNAIVTKINSSGVFQWQTTVTSPSWVRGFVKALRVRDDGTLVVAGTYGNGMVFGNTTMTNAGMYVAKMSASGDWDWISTGGAHNQYDVVAGLAIQPSGAIIVAAVYQQWATPTYGSVTLPSSDHQRDIALVKLGADGTWLAAERIGKNGDAWTATEDATDIEVLPNGKTILLANFSSTNLSVGSSTVSTAGGHDILVTTR